MLRSFLIALLLCGITTAAPSTGLPRAGSVSSRIASRTFPSIFQAWNPAENIPGENAITTQARHDLIFHAPDFFGLRWDAEPTGLATGFRADSVAVGMKKRGELLKLNSSILLLCEIRYRDAHRSHLPDDSLWWLRGPDGRPVVGWEEGQYLLLDFHNPDYRKQVARQAKAAMASGVFDGIFLDWWEDGQARLDLIREMRAAIGEDALVLVNANDRTSPMTAAYINGHFMECYRSKSAEDWKRIEDTLVWSETHLRKPRINCLEIWYENSRSDLPRMRAATSLALVRSDGYSLFADPNPLPTPDHLHDWYSFWDAPLGKPTGPANTRPDGSTTRPYEKGLVIYNPPGGRPVTVRFDKPHRRHSTGELAAAHEVQAQDGEIFLLP